MTDYTKFPGATYFGIGQRNDYVTQLGTWLIERGASRFYKVGAGPAFGPADQAACAAFQRAQGWTGSDVDGIPGPGTWELLATNTGNSLPLSGNTPTPDTPHPDNPPAPVSWVAPIGLSAVLYDRSVGNGGSTLDATQALCDRLGVNAKYWLAGIDVAANRESSYRWDAVNNWDTNAHGPKQADGYPLFCSRGVLQCIPQTFAAYHMVGTPFNIYDGPASIGASMNYVIARYGVARDGHDLASKVQQFDPARPPRGY